MTKRINPYTSTSIGKDKLVLLNELLKYVKENTGFVATQQHVIDLAVQQAWDNRAEFAKTLVETQQDPEVTAFLRMQAKMKETEERLRAAGKL